MYVSEASLSRFAKKCGYKGYREFIFAYEQVFETEKGGIGLCALHVLDTYEELLQKSRELVDDEQMGRVERMLTACRRIRVYGKGSSGYAAEECSVRFMRMGVDIEAITDTHIMKMSAALADSDTLVMAITLSGTTEEIMTAVKFAKKKGARVILITANRSPELCEMCDEVIYIAAIRNMDEGTLISPQFPIQIMIDILFTCFFEADIGNKRQRFNETLEALYDKGV